MLELIGVLIVEVRLPTHIWQRDVGQQGLCGWANVGYGNCLRRIKPAEIAVALILSWHLETARYASELCGKEDRTHISYIVSESSTNANVGLLSGRTSSSKGSISASKQYQKHKEPLFEEKIFFDLKNA